MPLWRTCLRKLAPAARLTLRREGLGSSGWSRSSPARSSHWGIIKLMQWCLYGIRFWLCTAILSLLQSGGADLGVVAVCRHQELQAGRGSQVSSKHLVWLHWSDPRNCWSFLPLSWLVSCLRDQVELADGDALVPVAHFSKEVCFFVSFLFSFTLWLLHVFNVQMVF